VGSVIRPATTADQAGIARILDAAFGPVPFEVRQRLWRWRNEENPASSADFPAFLVAEAEGEIVGVHGLLPLRMRVGSHELTAACACDFAVSPSARGVGVGLKVQAMKPSISPVHLSTSANHAAQRLTVALGGSDIGAGMVSYVKPLRLSPLLAERLDRTTGRNWVRIARAPTLMAGRLLDGAWNLSRALRPSSTIPQATLREVAEFDERYDNFANRILPADSVHVIRDAAYLNWRYSRYPFKGIRSFELVRGEELLGFGVVHLHEDPSGTTSSSLLELAGHPDVPAAISVLLDEACRRSIEGRAATVSARAASPEIVEILLGSGFHRRERTYSPCTVKGATADLAEILSDDSRWHLSLGDGDVSFFLDWD